MECAYLVGLAGLTYAVWKNFPPEGFEDKNLPKTCPGKPLVILYYDERSELSQQFLRRWEAQKKLYLKLLDFMEVRMDHAEGTLPKVRFDMGPFVLSGKNLADFETFFRVFDLPDASAKEEGTSVAE